MKPEIGKGVANVTSDMFENYEAMAGVLLETFHLLVPD